MLTREKLASVVDFDPAKGRFFWRGVGRGKPRGKEAGSFDAHGYGQINVFGKVWKEHRLVWLWVHGEFPDKQIDHINHDRRDNRPENLRLADNMENHRNRPMQNSNKSGFVGVWHNKRCNRFFAYINVNGKRIRLGTFRTIEEAIAVRSQANKRYGYHENHGSEYGRPKHKKLKEFLGESGINMAPGRLSDEQMRQTLEAYRKRNES